MNNLRAVSVLEFVVDGEVIATKKMDRHTELGAGNVVEFRDHKYEVSRVEWTLVDKSHNPSPYKQGDAYWSDFSDLIQRVVLERRTPTDDGPIT